MSLKNFREKFPGKYDNVPDLELAEAVYQKFYSNYDKSEIFKQLFPQISEKRVTNEIIWI